MNPKEGWGDEFMAEARHPDMEADRVGPSRVEPQGQRPAPRVLGGLAGLSAGNRKTFPVASGNLAYFPRAAAEVAHVSWVGNEQHHPGSPLHWDRSKSTDELDALLRHLLQEIQGEDYDTDGVLHLAKVAWRALAALEKKLEGLEAAPKVADPPRFGSLRNPGEDCYRQGGICDWEDDVQIPGYSRCICRPRK